MDNSQPPAGHESTEWTRVMHWSLHSTMSWIWYTIEARRCSANGDRAELTVLFCTKPL